MIIEGISKIGPHVETLSIMEGGIQNDGTFTDKCLGSRTTHNGDRDDNRCHYVLNNVVVVLCGPT